MDSKSKGGSEDRFPIAALSRQEPASLLNTVSYLLTYSVTYC